MAKMGSRNGTMKGGKGDPKSIGSLGSGFKPGNSNGVPSNKSSHRTKSWSAGKGDK